MLSPALLAAASPPLGFYLAWTGVIVGGLVAALLLRAFYFRVGRIVGALERIEARLERLEARPAASPEPPAATSAPLASVVEGRPWAVPVVSGGASTTGEVPGKISPAGMHPAVVPLTAASAVPEQPQALPAAPIPGAPIPAAAVPAAAVPAVAVVTPPADLAPTSGPAAPAAPAASSSAAGPDPILTPVAAMPALIAQRERAAERRLTEPATPGHPAPLPPSGELVPAASAGAEPAAAAASTAVASAADGEGRPPTSELPWVKKQDTAPGLAATRVEPPADPAPAAGKLSPPPEGSRYCPYCGHATSKRNLFCQSCESKLP